MRKGKRLLAILLPLAVMLCALTGASINAIADDDLDFNFSGGAGSVSLSVNENIVSHYYFDAATYEAMGGAKYQYSYNNGDTQDKTDVVSDVITFDSAKDANGEIEIDVAQAAAQISEPITVRILNSNDSLVTTISYTAKDYCDTVIGMNADELSQITTHGAKLQQLCKAIVMYAKSSQGVFSDYMAKEGSVAITNNYATSLNLNEATYDSSAYYKVNGANIGFKTASFMCESTAKMRFYLSVNNVNDPTVYDEPDVTLPNGATIEKGMDSEGNYFFQINNIKPVDFDSQIRIDYAGAYIQMSVLDYAGKVIDAPMGGTITTELKTLAKSIIRYNENAEEFFNAPATVYVPAVAPTCTTPGNEAHYTYQGNTYSDADATTPYDPTISALGHSYNAVVTAPTCTEGGYTTYTCTRCGDSYTGDETAALGHSWNNGEIITAANCVDTGVKKYTCTRDNCGATKNETVPVDSTNHKTVVNDAAVAATCTATGLSAGSHCSACNTVITAQTQTAALGHSYGAWSVTTGATLSNSGAETRSCTRGDDVQNRTVQPFTLKFDNTADYLYRIGNGNNVSLGSILDNASGANISNVTATIAVNTGNATGTFTANNSDWRNSTLKFTNTGIVTVTFKHGSTTITTLKLEVVAGTNRTSLSGSIGNSVLLNDVAITNAVNVNSGTLYGNGFTIDATGTAPSGTTVLGSLGGAINLNSGTLNNVSVIGPNFNNAAVYQTTDSNCVFTVKTSGECYIYNSYIFGSRAPIGTYGTSDTTVTNIENTVLDGGRYSNIFLRFGKLNLHNVTTINQPRTTINGNTRCGYGIVISDEASEKEQITATGYLKQYNWVGRNKDVNYFKGDNSSSTSNTAVETLFTNMYSKASSLTVSYNNDSFINTGILSLGSNAPHATGEAVSSYSAATVSLSNTTGWVMTSTAFDANDAFKYYNATDYSPSTQPPTLPTFTWSYPSEYSSTEKKVGLSYNQGGSVNFTPTGILTAKKYNNNLNVAVSMNGTDYTNKTITFNQPGDYTIVYTVTDPYNYAADGTTTSSRTYTKTLDVTVTEKISSISDPEFTFYGGSSAGTNLGSKIVDIGGKHYVMPNVSATSDTVKSTTVSGTTVYMPVVTVRFKDNSSDFNYKFPLFYNINIKNYTDASGSSTTYNKSTSGSSLPSPFERVTADPNWNGKTSFNSYSKDSTYGLCAVSAAIGSNQSARNATIQFKFTAGNGEEYYYYLYYDAEAHNKPSGCVAEGSLVTMADGTKKAIEDVQQGDMVMTWSMWNGQYEAMPVGIKWYHGTQDWDVLTLNFSDGTDVRTINEHGFFDVDKNTYAYITPDNVDNYIGDSFIKQASDGSSIEVTLNSYSLTTENVGCYSLQTVRNDNFIVDDMLSITAEEAFPGKFEWFEVGEGMKYDEANMQAEIAKYGLYTYDEWSDYLTEEQFYALNGPYYKVLIGRGVMTEDELINIIKVNVN